MNILKTKKINNVQKLALPLLQVKKDVEQLKAITPHSTHSKLKIPKTTFLISGPCALESREQLRLSVSELKKMGISHIRASLYKPRTQPGWEGLGDTGIPILLEETLPCGLIPATEILTPEHARKIVSAIKAYGNSAKILLWIGSRNQNHIQLKQIASILSKASDQVELMLKNQMWEDERHWIGLVKHVAETDFPKKNLLLCHRGFSPGRSPNPHAFRNLPNLEMATRLRKETGLRMILDPSHIGGEKDKVIQIIETSLNYEFDGYMIEVHPNSKEAKTDAKQQLEPLELKNILEESTHD